MSTPEKRVDKRRSVASYVSSTEPPAGTNATTHDAAAAPRRMVPSRRRADKQSTGRNYGHLARMPSPLASPVRVTSAGNAASRRAREEAEAMEEQARVAAEQAREAAGIAKPPVRPKVDTRWGPDGMPSSRPSSASNNRPHSMGASRSPTKTPTKGGHQHGSAGTRGAHQASEGGGGSSHRPPVGFGTRPGNPSRGVPGANAAVGFHSGASVDPAPSGAHVSVDDAEAAGGHHVAAQLWDLIARAVEKTTSALDEAARAVASDAADTSTGGAAAGGTSGFAASSRTSSKTTSGSVGVSGTTRRRVTQRAAVKLRGAREELAAVSARFFELRRHSAALADALARAEHAQAGVTRQLQAVTGHAEEQANRLRVVERRHAETGQALNASNDALEQARREIDELKRGLETETSEKIDAVRRAERLEEVNARREADARSAEEAAAADRETATAASNALAAAVERGERGEDSAARHKEAVAKLTADNMVFLVRLKESEADLAALRAEADVMRAELEETRGAWFDRARKDVERVVQRAMLRAEAAEAEAEAAKNEATARADEWRASLDASEEALAETRARCARLAEAAEQATAVAADASERARRSESDAERAREAAAEATAASKAASSAMAEAREELGVLRLRHASETARAAASLEALGRERDALRADAEMKAKALATQQAVNAGVMKSKNDMEWRLFEMQAALAKLGVGGFEGGGLEDLSRGPTDPAETPLDAAASLDAVDAGLEAVAAASKAATSAALSAFEAVSAGMERRAAAASSSSSAHRAPPPPGPGVGGGDVATPLMSDARGPAAAGGGYGTAPGSIPGGNVPRAVRAAPLTPSALSPPPQHQKTSPKSSYAAIAAAASKAAKVEETGDDTSNDGHVAIDVTEDDEDDAEEEDDDDAWGEDKAGYRPYQRLHGEEPTAVAPSREGPQPPPLLGPQPARSARGSPGKRAGGGGTNFKSSMAAAAAAAAAAAMAADDGDAEEEEEEARAWMASVALEAEAEAARKALGAKMTGAPVPPNAWERDQDGDEDGHDVVAEEVFLDAAKSGGARHVPNAPARVDVSHGWIGGRPSLTHGSLPASSTHTSELAVDGSSDEEEDRRRIAAGQPLRVPAFDDSDDGEDGAGGIASDFLEGAIDDDAKTHLLSAASGNPRPSYGATNDPVRGGRARSATPVAEVDPSDDDDSEDDAVDLPGYRRGGSGVRFSNALPMSGRALQPAAREAPTRDVPGGRVRDEGSRVAFTNALPRLG